VAGQLLVYATYVSPFPTNSGERIRVLNMIAALRSLGHEIHAFVGNYDNVDLAAQDRQGVRFHQIPFEWPRLRQAVGIYFRPHRNFIRQIAALHKVRPLGAAILDYGFIAAQIEPLARLGIPVILGTHNVESALTGQVPKPSLAAKAAIRLRQAIEFSHERLFFPSADAVICVSEDDRRAYARFIPESRLHVIPNFIDIPEPDAARQRQNRIIMSGSFDNFQNREGLEWFVRNVWDAELRMRTELHVAGKQSREAVRALGHVPGVTGLGARDDLLADIASSRCAIVPLSHGGGTRIKCLEAMAARTPVVTTAKGCEGIAHGGAFRVADDAASFKAAILDVLSDSDRSNAQALKAREIFDRLYSLAANAPRLDKILAEARRAAGSRGRPGAR
jgi:glycosyltransferase involved in cell wall biosynthesis